MSSDDKGVWDYKQILFFYDGIQMIKRMHNNLSLIGLAQKIIKLQTLISTWYLAPLSLCK